MRKIFSLLCLSLLSLVSFSQDPHRFDAEIKKFVRLDPASVDTEKLIVFSGSSSIRFWESLSTDYPKSNILNTGFGGSQMSDLLYFADDLLLKFLPTQVFIYEGDNDIAADKSTVEIMGTLDSLVALLQSKIPSVNIVLIAAKPSVARWSHKLAYLELNQRYREYAYQNEGVEFADVWTPMMDEKGVVLPELFIEDQLHMNQHGYKIWAEALRPFLLKN